MRIAIFVSSTAVVIVAVCQSKSRTLFIRATIIPCYMNLIYKARKRHSKYPLDVSHTFYVKSAKTFYILLKK